MPPRSPVRRCNGAQWRLLCTVVAALACWVSVRGANGAGEAAVGARPADFTGAGATATTADAARALGDVALAVTARADPGSDPAAVWLDVDVHNASAYSDDVAAMTQVCVSSDTRTLSAHESCVQLPRRNSAAIGTDQTTAAPRTLAFGPVEIPTGTHTFVASVRIPRSADGSEQLDPAGTFTVTSATTSVTFRNQSLETAAMTPDYWRALCPRLHLTDHPEGAHATDAHYEWQAAPAEDLVTYSRGLRYDGYFVSRARKAGAYGLPTPRAPPASGSGNGTAFEAMAECIISMRESGWPATMAWMFDEFWLLMGRITKEMAPLIGGDSAMTMQIIWAYHIDYTDHFATGRAETAGWVPHRDRPWGTGVSTKGKPRPEAWPPTVNVWVPLTEATAENGCMYIVPRSIDAAVMLDEERRAELAATGVAAAKLPLAQLDKAGYGFDIHGVRALPALPGQYMAWDGDVLHWGSRGHEDAVPSKRISVNFEIVRSYEEGRALVEPFQSFWPAGIVPSFGFRLRALDSTVKYFDHLKDGRVLPAATRSFLLDGFFRDLAEAEVPCPDCDLVRGGLCGDDPPPVDGAECRDWRMW